MGYASRTNPHVASNTRLSVARHQAVGTGLAAGSMTASANSWDDYELQTDHYVIAFFLDDYYYNPFGYQDGSCDGVGDCTIGPSGGEIWLVAATIYLGSTVADQTNVPKA